MISPEELLLQCKRQNTYAEIVEELENAMHPAHKQGIVDQLRFEYVDPAPVLRLLPEKLVGVNIQGFDRLFKTTVSAAFSYASKKVNETVLRVGIRQYLYSTPQGSREREYREVYLILELTFPESRLRILEHVNDVLHPEAHIIYGVTMDARLDGPKNYTTISMMFEKIGHVVFEEFWSSKPGLFFIAKYNDYLLN